MPLVIPTCPSVCRIIFDPLTTIINQYLLINNSSITEVIIA